MPEAATPHGLPAFDGTRRVPDARNEPILAYAPGSPERAQVKAELKRIAGERLDIPLIIGGKEVRTGNTRQAVVPHNHGHVLADVHQAAPEHIERAIVASAQAARDWNRWPFEDRVAIFFRAAALLAGPWRATLNAATMLNQSKTVHQAEIDAACELIDFWRFNLQFAQELYEEQPISDEHMRNVLDYRPLEGFVYAITPFNFTSIDGNLPTSPAIMGNTVVWKPSSTALLSNYYLMKLLEEAGLPPGVINFIPGNAGQVSDVVLNHRDLAGVHFTGSTEVFQSIWSTIGGNIENYRCYPRIVGETGGKDFIVAHHTADPASLAVAIVRGSFEFQGQKCSAASRVYVPKTMWGDVKERVVAMMKDIRVGDVSDFRNYMGAVIDKKAFDKISSYVEDGKKNATVVAGGGARGESGYFVDPTLVETDDPNYRLMQEEIFGPVVTAYPYDDGKWDETLDLVDTTSPYALTGAIFARDRHAVRDASIRLRNAAGNFYVNDKPTGAVVGQQPFGGGRASGTNDKAGSKMNLMRWVSARAIKELYAPPTDYRYPFMSEE